MCSKTDFLEYAKMVLSEAEAEARLADLRRQREAIDRAITDLTLYLELGRRLGGGVIAADKAPVPPERPLVEPDTVDPGPPDGRPPRAVPDAVAADLDTRQAGPLRPHHGHPPEEGGREGRDSPRPSGEGDHAHHGGGVEPLDRAASRPVAADGPSAPAGLPAESADAMLSEGVLARRYGRALIQAALAVLEEAGRPMHAGEIEAALSARGFSVPGQHDPVAALNTRLWKRSGPGGPLRRLGDAVYALPERDEHGRD